MTLEDRIILLERRHKRTVRGLLLLLGTAVTALMLGQGTAPPSVLEGREIRLLDAAGKPAAVLSTRDGSTQLALMDKTGKPRVILITSDAGGESSSGLVFQDAKEHTQVELAASSSVRRVRLTDLAGDDAIKLKVSGTRGLEVASLGLMDTHGNEVVSISRSMVSMPRPANRVEPTPGEVIQESSPRIALLGPHGGAVQLQVWGRGEPSLDLWDKDKRLMLRSPE